MRRNLGVWIDHTKAVIVIVSEKGEEIQSIQSDLQHPMGGSVGADTDAREGDQRDVSEELRTRRFADQLNKFYDEVISTLRTCGPYLLFGPGEAKVELATRLESGAVRGRIVGVETADKMTNLQIIAKVRRYFAR